MIDEILKRLGLKYEDLNSAERDTLQKWTSNLNTNDLTVEKVKSYVHSLRDSIEQELVNEPEFTYIFIFKVINRKQIYLKARLRNIMLLSAFLDTPERAKQALEKAIAGIVKPKSIK